MKKELLKGFTMLALIVALALATAVLSANAQSPNRVVASVPFEFVVGDQAMSSGEYSFKATAAPDNGLMIQSADAKVTAIRFTNAIDPQRNRNKTHARLVFHRYGQSYFLAEVWSGADSAGAQLLKSHQELALESELASIPSKCEQTLGAYEAVEVLAALR